LTSTNGEIRASQRYLNPVEFIEELTETERTGGKKRRFLKKVVIVLKIASLLKLKIN
jgi:hypothetical protein